MPSIQSPRSVRPPEPQGSKRRMKRSAEDVIVSLTDEDGNLLVPEEIWHLD